MAFKADPFERSDEEIEKRTAEEKAKRIARREAEDDEHFEKGTGPYSDGRVIDAAADGINRVMDGPLADMARGAGFEDPDAEMGSFAVGVGEKIRGIRGQARVPEGSDVVEQPDLNDPPLELRMPK